MQPYMNDFYRLNGYKVDRSNSCRNFDCVISKGDINYRIEEKYLFTKEYKNILIEFVQDLITLDSGWFYHVDCEYLHWMYCGETRIDPPQILYKVSWMPLKELIQRTLKTSPTWTKFNINTEHYGITLNYPFEWNILQRLGIAKRINLMELDTNIIRVQQLEMGL